MDCCAENGTPKGRGPRGVLGCPKTWKTRGNTRAKFENTWPKLSKLIILYKNENKVSFTVISFRTSYEEFNKQQSELQSRFNSILIPVKIYNKIFSEIFRIECILKGKY